MNDNITRVELHCHTNMSLMDGTSSVHDIIQFAYDNGMPAIAITDTEKIFAYPDAARKLAQINDPNFKVIYGVEVNVVDDTAPIVSNSQNQSLDSDVVIIFIDAAGYSPELDEVATLEATRIRNGKICETFFEFVKYSIDPEPQENYRTIDAVFPDFQKFVGNTTIASYQNNHFMNTHCFYCALARRYGTPADNTHINLTSLSNLLFPKLANKAFPEIELMKKFEITEGYTSEVQAELFLELRDIMHKKNIRNLCDIQNFAIGNADYIKTLPIHESTILVRNQTGLKNLYKLLTDSELKYFHDRPLIPKSQLNLFRHDLLIGSSSINGVVQQKLALGFSLEDTVSFAQYYDYLEIQPLANNNKFLEYGIYNHIENRNDLRRINRQIIKLGKMLKKPVVATCDSHFLREDGEMYARLRQIQHDDFSNHSSLYLRTTAEMLDEFSYLGKKTAREVVITNTRLISNMIENVTPLPIAPVTPNASTKSVRVKPGKLIFATNKVTGKTLLYGYDKLENAHFLLPDNLDITTITPLHKVPETGEVVTELDYHDLAEILTLAETD